MAAWEQSIGRSVCIHRLVSLIKSGEGVAEGDPAWCEVSVQSIGLLEVLPRQVILFDQKVVGALDNH